MNESADGYIFGVLYTDGSQFNGPSLFLATSGVEQQQGNSEAGKFANLLLGHRVFEKPGLAIANHEALQFATSKRIIVFTSLASDVSIEPKRGTEVSRSAAIGVRTARRALRQGQGGLWARAEGTGR